MELTPAQIKILDEVTIDRRTADATLQVALTFHSNVLNVIEKQEEVFWKELIDQHNLDTSKVWAVRRENGSIKIVEKGNRQQTV